MGEKSTSLPWHWDDEEPQVVGRGKVWEFGYGLGGTDEGDDNEADASHEQDNGGEAVKGEVFWFHVRQKWVLESNAADATKSLWYAKPYDASAIQSWW